MSFAQLALYLLLIGNVLDGGRQPRRPAVAVLDLGNEAHPQFAAFCRDQARFQIEAAALVEQGLHCLLYSHLILRMIKFQRLIQFQALAERQIVDAIGLVGPA